MSAPESPLKTCSACMKSFPLDAEHFLPLKKGAWRGWSTECRPCRNKRYRSYYEKNREKVIARATASTRKRRERPEVREQERQSSREAKRRQLADPVEREKHNERGAKWRRDNPERARLFKHERPAAKRKRMATRTARKFSCIPPWLTKDHWRSIEMIYAIADFLTRETGIKYEVDHYFPLKNNVSCGLHVPWNLRVITLAMNKSKGNRMPQQIAA